MAIVLVSLAFPKIHGQLEYMRKKNELVEKVQLIDIREGNLSYSRISLFVFFIYLAMVV